MASYYQLYREGEPANLEKYRKTLSDVCEELLYYCERDEHGKMKLLIESISRYGKLPGLSIILGYAMMKDSVNCVKFLIEEMKVMNTRGLEIAVAFQSEKCIKYFNGA